MILYVYYKVNASLGEGLLPRIRQMQEELVQRFPQLATRLMKRPELDTEGRATWMETYEIQNIDQMQFNTMLDALVSRHELPTPRKKEYFVNL